MRRFDWLLAIVAVLVVGSALANNDPIAELPEGEDFEPLALGDDREPIVRGAMRDLRLGGPKPGDWVLVERNDCVLTSAPPKDCPDMVRVLPKPQCWAEMRRINFAKPGYAVCIRAGSEP